MWQGGGGCGSWPQNQLYFHVLPQKSNFFLSREFFFGGGSKNPNFQMFKPVSWPYFSIDCAENKFAHSFLDTSWDYKYIINVEKRAGGVHSFFNKTREFLPMVIQSNLYSHMPS